MRVHLGGERKRNDGLNHGILMIMEIGLKSETHATVKGCLGKQFIVHHAGNLCRVQQGKELFLLILFTWTLSSDFQITATLPRCRGVLLVLCASQADVDI